MATLVELLKTTVDMNGSDLHITAETPPQVRVNGHLQRLPGSELNPSETKQLVYSVLTDAQKKTFEESKELDFSFGIKGLSRFRCNVFNQRGAVAAVYRVISETIRSFGDLGLPAVLATLAERPRGLILVTGPTGSGKSTTLAAMIDKINLERHDHILTIEDPIEYIHHHKKGLVSQREVGADTDAFPTALKYVLRQDPDVILIGEMRDRETFGAALTIAETGHLVFATLHTNSASESINRIVDVFPADQQKQIQTQLSFVLEGVITQQLVPRWRGGGRAMVAEVLVATPAVKAVIREGKTHQIYSALQAGAKHGMHTMDQHLADLVKVGKISYEMGLEKCHHVEDFNRLTGRG